jgi:hypothetical protein
MRQSPAALAIVSLLARASACSSAGDDDRLAHAGTDALLPAMTRVWDHGWLKERTSINSDTHRPSSST